MESPTSSFRVNHYSSVRSEYDGGPLQDAASEPHVMAPEQREPLRAPTPRTARDKATRKPPYGHVGYYNDPSPLDLHTLRKPVFARTMVATTLGLGITAATAATVPPLVGWAPTLLACLGLMGADTMVNGLPKEEYVTRSMGFGAAHICLGALVSGVSVVSSPLLIQAAVLTAVAVGVMAAAVAMLPPQALDGLYPMILGVTSMMLVLTLTAAFAPASWPIARAAQEGLVWLGLTVGMGGIALSLQQTVQAAQGRSDADALSLSMSLVSSIVNTFVQFAALLSRHDDEYA